jgi:group I intron endonuclease
MNSTEFTECEVTGKMSTEKEKMLVTDTMSKKIGIYGLQNKLKPHKWYIGLSVDIHDRWKTAYDNVSCKTQPKIYRALKKYGINNFNKVILEECDKDELSNKEIVWIKYYDSKNNGYNLTDGGYGGDLRSGASNSPEHRKNISASKKGKKFSDAHRKALSDAWKRRSPEQNKKYGRVFTEEERLKMSEKMKGHTFSKERNKKISDALFKHYSDESNRIALSEAMKRHFSKDQCQL